MKKTSLVCLIVSLFSGASIAGGKFTSKDGYLVMPDISVDDKTFYDTVTLQLNFSNGTFSYISSKPKPTTLFDKPVEPQDNEEGFTIGSLGCTKTASTKVSCYLLIVNNNADTNVQLYVSGAGNNAQSLLIDNLNNTYHATKVMISSEESGHYANATLFQGIPVKMRLDFEGISSSASSVLALKPALSYNNFQVIFYPTFKNINF